MASAAVRATPFCCDLLSVAMGKAPAGCAWVTVMGNMNTLAVATLADAACGIAASSLGGICTTVNSNIQFLNAAFWPKYLIAEAKPKKFGRKIRTFLVEIRDDRDTLICTVDMVFYSLQQ